MLGTGPRVGRPHENKNTKKKTLAWAACGVFKTRSLSMRGLSRPKVHMLAPCRDMQTAGCGSLQ